MPKHMQFFRNFSPEDYARLINSAQCIVGNSSSGLREGAFLGVPCVNIGSRQQGRERAENVSDVGYDANAIYTAIEAQLAHGRYPRSLLVGNGHAGARIADILADAPLRINKTLNYIMETK